MSSTVIITGSCIFVGLWLITAIALHFTVTKDVTDQKLKKEYRGMAYSLTFIGAFCMWLMWICVYMHQMNPLISPIPRQEHA